MITPVFVKNSAFIVLSSSNEYVPYLYTTLYSIIKNSSLKHNYDLLILEKNISAENKAKILKLSKGNISVRFYNFNRFIEKYHFNFFTYDHVSVETYFKLCIPLILKNVPKSIFLDSDVIVSGDLFDLYSTDIKGYPLGAAHCCLISGLYNYNNNLKTYIRQELCLSGVKNYFQGGVLLIDTNKWKKLHASEALIESVSKNNFQFVDQDALNKYFVHSIKFIDQKWNYETVQKGFIPTYAVTDKDILLIHKKAKACCKIIHYSGKYKPWFYPDEEMAEIWWQYARQTPFYEEIISRMIDFKISQKIGKTDKNVLLFRSELLRMQSDYNHQNLQLRQELSKTHFPNINRHFAQNEERIKLLFVMHHLVRFELKKWKYGIKKAVSFGKKYEKYQNKFTVVKQLLQNARKLKKQLLHIP